MHHLTYGNRIHEQITSNYLSVTLEDDEGNIFCQRHCAANIFRMKNSEDLQDEDRTKNKNLVRLFFLSLYLLLIQRRRKSYIHNSIEMFLRMPLKFGFY